MSQRLTNEAKILWGLMQEIKAARCGDPQADETAAIDEIEGLQRISQFDSIRSRCQTVLDVAHAAAVKGFVR